MSPTVSSDGASAVAPLRVLVDAVSARTGGGGTYIVAQMEALARVEGLVLTIYAAGTVARRLVAACPGATVRSRPELPAARRLVWEQLVLTRKARSHDVVYMPGNFALMLSRRPQVLVIQNAWYFTDAVRAFRRTRCARRMRLRVCVESLAARASIRRADTVLAVSQSMLAAIQADLGEVAHARVLASAAPDLDVRGAVARPGIVGPYALVVAHDDPHKEWDRLITLFLTRADLPKLVIAGRVGAARKAGLERVIAARGPGRVVLLGAIEQTEVLAGLYREASCCVAHSWFESFGLTPGEGLAQGTPVVAADIAAHREVCGRAASYYDPGDDEALAAAVLRATAGPHGVRPVLRRTWQENATELARALRDTAARRSLANGES